jgi:CDP-glycerol glycerophosphotransferase (TagB/SpsB family)
LVIKASKTYELMVMADMVITKDSTVGYEAILMGMPLIVFEYDKADVMDYVKKGCALSASSRKELAAAIAELKPRAKLWVFENERI